MSGPTVPAQETARLQVVHSLGLLDTAEEERFDRIARTASLLFSVPIAFVSLLDADRQWSKTCIGPLPKQFNRADGICSTTILHDTPLVVRDLAAEARFSHLPAVAGEPHVRFYAGVPLRIQGHAVGTLCILDVQPRDLDADGVAALEDLAAWAEDELGQVELAAARQHEREAEAALLRLRMRHDLVLAAAQTGVLGTTPDGRVELANPAACSLLGVRDPLGLSLHDALHRSSGHAAEDCDLLAVVEGGMSYRGNQDGIVHEDGSRTDLEYMLAPLLEDGRNTGAVVTLNDITERRAVDRMKDEFVSVVSHELRTPLTSIRGSLGLLASARFGALPAQAARLVEIAVGNTDRLVRLVNDILDLDRLESGKMEVDLRVQPLRPLLEAARDAVAGMAHACGVEVEVDDSDTDGAVDGDLLVQAVTNLSANAVKFSAAGGLVTLSAHRVDDQVLVRVRDRGRGIPKEKLERVFERFEQVDSSDARDKGGTGLGLAITRRIATTLGGRVTVESEVGRGSTFTLVLPGPTPGARPEALPDVVLVEDDADLVELLSTALTAVGLRVASAATEDEAVALVLRSRPRLLMLDVELVSGSGFGVAARLRAAPSTAGTAVVVATVHDLDETARRRLTVGPTRFVRKGRGDDDVVQALVDAAGVLPSSSSG